MVRIRCVRAVEFIFVIGYLLELVFCHQGVLDIWVVVVTRVWFLCTRQEEVAGATEYAVLAMGLAKSVHQVGERPMSGDGCDHSQMFERLEFVT